MFNVAQHNPKAKKISTILLIEDDRMVSTLIKSYLEKSGFVVHQALRKDFELETVSKHQPDLVILDIGLPGIDGLQVCQQVREVYDGPITILSGCDQDKEQITAFQLGADDYIVKPVAPGVLKVRIEALLRRQPLQDNLRSPSIFRVGDITLFPQANKCEVKEKRVSLSSFEFQLLALLLRNAGRVMTRDAIYNLLLGREYNGTERTVDVRISKLRDKLMTEGMVKTKIETVWGKGYILNEIAA
ncbi:MAG: response regulator transcription factor [Colwellia sp.]|nr:response regulator transcription factor [Colwellia sp.]